MSAGGKAGTAVLVMRATLHTGKRRSGSSLLEASKVEGAGVAEAGGGPTDTMATDRGDMGAGHSKWTRFVPPVLASFGIEQRNAPLVTAGVSVGGRQLEAGLEEGGRVHVAFIRGVSSSDSWSRNNLAGWGGDICFLEVLIEAKVCDPQLYIRSLAVDACQTFTRSLCGHWYICP